MPVGVADGVVPLACDSATISRTLAVLTVYAPVVGVTLLPDDPPVGVSEFILRPDHSDTLAEAPVTAPERAIDTEVPALAAASPAHISKDWAPPLLLPPIFTHPDVLVQVIPVTVRVVALDERMEMHAISTLPLAGAAIVMATGEAVPLPTACRTNAVAIHLGQSLCVELA
jgi:hypothetical protein